MTPAPVEAEKSIRSAAADRIILKISGDSMLEDYKLRLDKLIKKLIFLRDCL